MISVMIADYMDMILHMYVSVQMILFFLSDMNTCMFVSDVHYIQYRYISTYIVRFYLCMYDTYYLLLLIFPVPLTWSCIVILFAHIPGAIIVPFYVEACVPVITFF